LTEVRKELQHVSRNITIVAANDDITRVRTLHLTEFATDESHTSTVSTPRSQYCHTCVVLQPSPVCHL